MADEELPPTEPTDTDTFDGDEDPITQLDLEELGLLTPGGEAEE